MTIRTLQLLGGYQRKAQKISEEKAEIKAFSDAWTFESPLHIAATYRIQRIKAKNGYAHTTASETLLLGATCETLRKKLREGPLPPVPLRFWLSEMTRFLGRKWLGNELFRHHLH